VQPSVNVIYRKDTKRGLVQAITWAGLAECIQVIEPCLRIRVTARLGRDSKPPEKSPREKAGQVNSGTTRLPIIRMESAGSS